MKVIAARLNQINQLLSQSQKIMIGLMFIIIVLWDFAFFLSTPISKIDPSQTKDFIVFNRGENIVDLVAKFKQKKYINHNIYLIIYAYLSGSYKNLQAGQYRLKNYPNVFALIDDLIQGKVMIENFAIIAGEDFNQVLKKQAQTALVFNQQTKRWLSKLSKVNDLKTPQKVNLNLFFLADSYAYQYRDNFLVVLKASYQKMKDTLKALRAEFNSAWTRSKTDKEMIIIASLLEKESANFRDRRKIAGVIKNRLAIPMKLQIDASVIYAYKIKGKILNKLIDQDLKINSPYNTYQVTGLPIAPISIVSEDSLRAAFNPSLHQYLYYVAKNDGSHQFSKNYQGHLKVINKIKNSN